LENLHAADPRNIQVTMLLADSCLAAGENSRVVDLLQPIKDSSDLGVAYMLGMALLRNQRITEAQTYLDRILRNGDTAEARFLLGTRMFESGDYPGAVKQLASAAELNPKLPELESFYGRALLNTGDADSAISAFQEELTANPNDFDANLALARIYAARKRYAEAGPFAENALKLRPNSADAKLALAECLAGKNEYSEARPLAEQAAIAAPKSVQAHRTLATIYGGLRLVSLRDREQSIADTLVAAKDPGPKLNEPAPDFELAEASTGKKVRLSDYRGNSPVTLIFGSYTCPNFRSAADTIKEMQQRYGRHVRFLLVYIREAHATDQWGTGRNTREDISLPPATTMAEKEEHAATCSRKLHLPFPAVVDNMDGAVESAYNAWPSRAYIVGKDGRILYSTRLTELDFDPARMESVLRRVAGTATVSVKK
jgi:tetratricopeptide (TPR) repeat protein